jgi:uncharacterized membrane protein HdeD (DUF308 family)
MTDVVNKGLNRIGLTVSKPLLALITLLFGILVIALPEFLAFLVGLYFIIQGALLFFDYYEIRRKL